jgi:hypothetical protein
MANRRRIPRPVGPTLWQQAANIRATCPDLHVSVRGKTLVADGVVRGDPLTRRYRVRLKYQKGFEPQVFILDPPLRRRRPDQVVAHTIGPDRPCLFTPLRDWHPRLYLGQSVVPWLMEWIVFYEGWLATGHWAGGGTLPAGYDNQPVVETAS